MCLSFARYGRMPKPTKPLTYPARDDSPSEPEEAPSSPSGCPAKATKSKCTMKKRKLLSKSPAAHKSKRPKLFTLRAREVGISDEEEEAEGQWDVEQQPQCSSTLEGCAFVPPSLCSPRLLTAEVEERVEEVDMRGFYFSFVFHDYYLTSFHASIHFSFFSNLVFLLCLPSLSIIQSLRSPFHLHLTNSLMFWSICLMFWALPKMLCALMLLASWHLMKQALLNPVNINWTCWL